MVLPGARRQEAKNPDATPAARSSRLAPVTPVRASLRQRLRGWWTGVVRWWVNPAPEAHELDRPREGKRHHRPIGIELAFFLHADGKVYQRQRDGSGDRLVEESTVRALVHAEYRMLLFRARRRAYWRGFFGRLSPLHKKALDAAKPRSAS